MLNSDTLKGQKQRGRARLFLLPSHLRPSNFLINGCGDDSFRGHRSSCNGFVLTDKLLTLNCARTGEQPLDDPINSSLQHMASYRCACSGTVLSLANTWAVAVPETLKSSTANPGAVGTPTQHLLLVESLPLHIQWVA